MRLRPALALLLFVLLSLAHGAAWAGASTSSVITSPDCIATAPGAGCVYVQQGTLGVFIQNPTGQTLGWQASDFAGGGPVHIVQNGLLGVVGGAVTNVPIRALQVPGVFTFLAAGTTLPAPDLSFNGITGVSGFYRLSASADIDWIGGIGVPTASGASTAGGTGTFGTEAEVINISGGGQAITVKDSQWGGAIHIGHPAMVIGFLETATFIYDNTGWQLKARSPSYYFNGGNVEGGRVFTTTSATPTPLMSWVKNGGVTNGLAFTCDSVSATCVSGTGCSTGDTAYWMGVKCGWDLANTVVIPMVVSTYAGNSSGSPPTGWALSCSDDATFHNLNGIGVTFANIKWRVNGCREAAPPF